MFIVPVANTALIHRRPWATYALIAVNAAVWLVTAFAPGPTAPRQRYDAVVEALRSQHGRTYEDRLLFELRLAYGRVVPKSSAEYRDYREARREAQAAQDGLDSWLVSQLGFIPEKGFDERLLTSLFLHGDFMHLFMNMLFLFLVGCNVEDQWGRWRYLAFFLAGGVVANLAHWVGEPRGELPLVGASGAVSAVMAAFVVFHAKAKIRFFWWFILFGFFHVPAIVAIAAWAGLQAWSALTAPVDSVVAYWAHLGGFAFGLLVAVPVRLRFGVPQEPEHTLPSREEAQVSLPGATLLGGDWISERALEDAEACLLAGDAATAATRFAELSKRDPKSVPARWGLTRALHSLGRRREATRLGETLMADLTRQGRTDEARRIYAFLMR